METGEHRESLFQQLADAIDQVFWFVEVEPERVLYVSPAFERLWGVPAQRLYEDPRVWTARIHPEDRERISRVFGNWLQGKVPEFRVEYRIVRPDESIRWILDQGVQVWGEGDELSHLSGIAKDITAEHEAKESLAEAFREINELKERLQRENAYLKAEIEGTAHEIVGESPVLLATLNEVDRVARTDASVLLLGETGTGKEQLARAIHRRSRRAKRPLVKVNCASLPHSLIESELFGHVKGSFTGAVSDRTGRFQLANEGTIFLDEIGELDLSAQTKLLHVLQEGEFERIGSSDTIQVDVRVIAATNRDLHAAIETGSFRSDLFYRLAVFPIHVPPLRERREDIPLLVRHFLSRKRAKLGKEIEEVPAKVLRALMAYDWPGNIRELENVIERAMILSPGKTLVFEDSLIAPQRAGSREPPTSNLVDVERAHIGRVLEDCNWRIKGRGQAAERLGLPPSTLRYRMRKLGIERHASEDAGA